MWFRLRKDLNWFEKRPLFGKRIVVTRTRKQASGLSSQLRALGADVIELPTIRIEPPSDLREFAELVQDAHSYDWIVFTSPNGVDAFFEIFFKLYDDAREIGGCEDRGDRAGNGATSEGFPSPCRFAAGRVRGGSGGEGI